MATKVRTLNFLPDIFRTTTNQHFLGSTLDQVVQAPNLSRIQGYIGRKFEYGINPADHYLVEPSKTRTDYQLEPGIVFKKPNSPTATDFLSYPGLVDALAVESGPTQNHSTLFSNEFYSWDSFVDLDKLVNFNQYYWLPDGPDSVEVTAQTIPSELDYTIVSETNDYILKPNAIAIDHVNPEIKLLRGGTYKFIVNQDSNFWIQTSPGLSGKDENRLNVSSREIYGVTNNGSNQGVITFTVPEPNDQAADDYPGQHYVDLVTTKSFNDIHGKRMSQIGTIDGVNLIRGKTVMFYGQPIGASASITDFFDLNSFDNTFDSVTTTLINNFFYKINFVNDATGDPMCFLSEDKLIPTDQKITAIGGTENISHNFVRSATGEIQRIPQITAPFDTFYYQDGSNPLKYGVIKIIQDNITDIINVGDIIGKKDYLAPNGVKLTNGLKINFTGTVTPAAYKTGSYYVEGVGKSISLIPVNELQVPEPFSQVVYTSFDNDSYDTVTFGSRINVPAIKDYITINRDSRSRNAWSRSNRWFHVDVLNATIEYNSGSVALAALNNEENRAKRPIIEFYPDLKLFNAGTISKGAVDFVDTVNIDALQNVSGQTSYYPDGSSSGLFEGARIIFTNDTDIAIRNKIYVVHFVSISGLSTPVINLQQASNGEVLENDMVYITRGENYAGHSFYFDGTNWNEAQFKSTVNQTPYFDVFDKNGTSLSDQSYYQGSNFKGSTLFQYAVGAGTNDTVLGIPLKYSSVNNIGDISFNVSINTDQFKYTDNFTSVTANVSVGYPHVSNGRYDYTEKLGWEVAADESFQYQAFDFVYNPLKGNAVFSCDVLPIDSETSNWPVLQVYIANQLVTEDQFIVTQTKNSLGPVTLVQLVTNPEVETPVQVLIHSASPLSQHAYYTIPTNLASNPFNEPIGSLSLGDIRGHYQSIFVNSTKITGNMFGANNYRDVGDVISYGTKIIQSSAPLPLAGTLLRSKNYSLFDSLTYSANEYVKFKALMVDTVNNADYNPLMTDAYILDDVLQQISAYKHESSSFFWSDMLPARAPHITNRYTFNAFIDTSYYTLSKVYDFENANYESVLIYLTKVVDGYNVTRQLVRGIDYTLSTTEPKVIMSLDMVAGDVITINEFNQTYGSYVPNTPTKLGLYPATIPEVIFDYSYVTPTYFIKGHDGSYTKLYGDYKNGRLIDFRDRLLFEFETRIYNNLKVSAKIPVSVDEVIPGQFRETEYSYEQIQNMYNVGFLNWVGQNRIDYKGQYYISDNPYTWNYNEAENKYTQSVFKQGNWRGIYQWHFDTTTPHITPWEMLGFTNKPIWWDKRYGVKPYTGENKVLWDDLEAGINYNNGNPVIVPGKARPGLSEMIPVDSSGKLIDPATLLLGKHNNLRFNRTWVAGDLGPSEFSYQRSSTYPFEVIKLLALAKPAKFFALGQDLDTYQYSEKFKQFLVNDRSRLSHINVLKYGSGTAQHSYLNWIVDYVQSTGAGAHDRIQSLLANVDVRLVYRLAGFSDKSMLNLYLEKSSSDSKNSSLLIPDNSYSLLLYDNQPFNLLEYTGVIIQKTENGYRVYGNSQSKVYFKTYTPIYNNNYRQVEVLNLKVLLTKDFNKVETIVPYGTEFGSIQALSEFMSNYSRYLIDLGMEFENLESGLVVNWDQMIAELLYWAQSGWEIGSTVTLNPAANKLVINKDSNVVQPLTMQNQNFALNQNLVPIQTKDMAVERDGFKFSVIPLSAGDTISYFTAHLSNIEHAIVFDNTTLFNDIIYNPVTGLRQYRILVKGTKTAEWNGLLDAQGFILNQDNIIDWQANTKYTKGIIVKYKNNYWISNKILQPAATFDTASWTKTDYDKVQKGLLPNANTRAYESTLYYDTTSANLKNDADLLAFSLIGYRPRDYLAASNLDDISQVNLYKNIISEKGTSLIANGVQGINLSSGKIDYDIYENWAIKTSEFGGVLNQNFIDIHLDEKFLTGNPSTISVIKDVPVAGAMQEVPLHSLINFGRPFADANILPTIPSDIYTEKLPSAGYVNFNDVKIHSYTFAQLGKNAVPLSKLYQGDYVWIADHNNTWKVYTPLPITNADNPAPVIAVNNNLNSTATVTFGDQHGLVKDDLIAILNFDSRVDGYYQVTGSDSLTSVTVTMTLDKAIKVLEGSGLAVKFQLQRVASPNEIENLGLVNNGASKNNVWVDSTKDGWAVYQKNNTYSYSELTNPVFTSKFGSSVAYSPKLGYFVADSSSGSLYRYTYNSQLKTYSQDESIDLGVIAGSGFGTSMATADDILVVTQPGSTSKLYIYELNQEVHQATVAQQQISITGNYGDSVAISGDKKWIYVSSVANSNIQVYNVDTNFLYTSTFLLVASTAAGGSSFQALGDVRTTFVTGDRISFSNSTTAPTYKVITSTYSATTNRTTFYINGKFDILTLAGTQVFKVTYNYSFVTNLTVPGLLTADRFGNSVSTNYDGTKVFIGAPRKDYVSGNTTVQNIGFAYAFNRMSYSIEVKNDTFSLVDTMFELPWSTTTVTMATTGTLTVARNDANNLVYKAETFNGTPIKLSTTGALLTGLTAGTTYYVVQASDTDASLTFKLSATLGGSAINLTGSQTGVHTLKTVDVVPEAELRLNGKMLTATTDYTMTSSLLTMKAQIKAGDIISIETGYFVRSQTFNSYLSVEDIRAGIFFGNSVDTNRWGNELIIGAPFDLTNQLKEGSVFRFTNSGKKYGIIQSTSDVTLNYEATILLNGYVVKLPSTGIAAIVTAINDARVPNVVASNVANKLLIQLRDINLGQVNNKLNIFAANSAVFASLGITEYTRTQVLHEVHDKGVTQFGYAVKFNEANSFAVGSPVCARYSPTTFDFVDDLNSDNDTIFDNNFTRFVDNFFGTGAVHVFDYMPSENESITNPGKYVYGQSVNDLSPLTSKQPHYGKNIAFAGYNIIIGCPDYLNGSTSGRVVVYQNVTKSPNWSVFRKSAPIVDINKLQTVQLYDNISNTRLESLDYIDPLQGKLLGAVRENIDFIDNVDPAGYNVASRNHNLVWGSNHVGKIWFDTSTTRFVNYHQNDLVYNSKYWGTVFPESTVTIYSWVESDVTPANYAGTGTPYDYTKYTTSFDIDSTGSLVTRYYYWVRKTNHIFSKQGKTLSDTIIESYIKSPQNSGISYFAPLLPNAVGLYNTISYIKGHDTNLHIGFSTRNTDDEMFNEFKLIRDGYATDFLAGVPNMYTEYTNPEALYEKLLDSLCGLDVQGKQVPDPYLPPLIQTGISTRPRQSFFKNRLKALENYCRYANTVLAANPISEMKAPSFLGATTGTTVSTGTRGPAFLTTSGTGYDTSKYWEYVYWWATGYNDATKTDIEVPKYYDLYTLSPYQGMVVGVTSNSDGKREVYTYNGAWERVGLQQGTIQIKSSLWEYDKYLVGFGNNFFDTVTFDEYPSTETRNIIRALNEEIYINDLLIHRNKSLILLFEYIVSENTNSQNYLPWLNKTSFIDVRHTLRELNPDTNFKRDNQEFLEGYINEVKPYRVVVKEFAIRYTKSETYTGKIADFDLPAQYNADANIFITPNLTFGVPATNNEFTADDAIWTSSEYNDWYNDYGLTLTGKDNYHITTLARYADTITDSIFVDSAYGLPIPGIIRIDDEYIGYIFVNRVTGELSGLTRGVENSPVSTHNTGTKVYIDLPGVVLLDSGRGYVNPPKVTAYIDTSIYPEPKRPAHLVPMMLGDKVIRIQILDPGAGYAVKPEIVIDPAISVTFDSQAISYGNDTFKFNSIPFVTGDLVRYSIGDNSDPINGLVDRQHYYVNVIESSIDPTNTYSIIALFTTYLVSINNRHRVEMYETSESTGHKLEITARAIPVMANTPTRELVTTLKFDRTSYNTMVTPWTSGEFYYSDFAATGKESSVGDTVKSTVEYVNLPDPTGNAVFSVFNMVYENTYTASITHFTGEEVVSATVSDTGEAVLQIGSNSLLLETNVQLLFATSGSLPTGLDTSSTYYAFSIRETPSGAITFKVSATPVVSESTATAVQVSGSQVGNATVRRAGYVYSVNDVVVIPGSKLEGVTGVNDCYILVTAVDGFNRISTFTVTGTPAFNVLSSAQGAVLPISTVRSVSGKVICGLNYSYFGDVSPAQIKGLPLYFYKVHAPYVWTDSATVTITRATPGRLTIARTLTNKTITNDTPVRLSTTGALPTGLDNSTTYYVMNVSDTSAGLTCNLSLTPSNVGAVAINTTSAGSGVHTITRVGSAMIQIDRPIFNGTGVTAKYQIKVLNSGSIYNYDDVITISGALLGGVAGVNDLELRVYYTPLNVISLYDVKGTAATTFTQYYVKPISATEVELYKDASMVYPVTTPFSFVAGDFAFLPEPAIVTSGYTRQAYSYVSYNNALYRCMESNNDSSFDYTKWEKLLSNDPSLNALDRITGFYQPTVGMPGKNLPLLVSGIDYPNNTYDGNDFKETTTLDTIIQDVPFYPTKLSIRSVIWDGDKYIAIGDTNKYSILLHSEDRGVTWAQRKISSRLLDVKDIIHSGTHYVITTANKNTPVMISYDSYTWITIGKFSPYDSGVYDDDSFDNTSMYAPLDHLYSTIYHNNRYIAVGDDILSSVDGYAWNRIFDFGSRLPNVLRRIDYISSEFFEGYIAVGAGYVATSEQTSVVQDIEVFSRILLSADGTKWEEVKPYLQGGSLNAVMTNGSIIVVAGDNSTVFYTTNGSIWEPGTVNYDNLDDSIRHGIYSGGEFVVVGDNGLIMVSYDGISWDRMVSNTTETLNHINYDGTHFVAVGENATILRSSDGFVWENVSFVKSDATFYEIKGDTFLSGYGPEELVPGVVTDNLSLTVITRPGSTWNPVTFQHTGFNVKSIRPVPVANVVSFDNVVENPAQLAVFVIDTTYDAGIRLYKDITPTATNPITYSVDWKNKKITLSRLLGPDEELDAPVLSETQTLLVEVYEIGNGAHIIRSTSDHLPVRIDPLTGNSEINLGYEYESAVATEPIVFLNGNKLHYGVNYTIQSTNVATIVKKGLPKRLGQAKMLFNGVIDPSVDFVSFAVLGDTSPTQYAYSVPVTETFTYAGYNTFTLNGNVNTTDYTNYQNAIVELNGVRMIPSLDYTITEDPQTLIGVLTTNVVFNGPDDIVSVTMFNDTRQQYLLTEEVTDKQVTPLYYVSTLKGALSLYTVIDPGLVDADLVMIDGIIGTTQLNNNTYYVKCYDAFTEDGLTYYPMALYYDQALGKPVTAEVLTKYISGGFIWKYSTTHHINQTLSLTDTERLYVTINGRRIDKNKLVLNTGNMLSILMPLSTSDEIIVTSMVGSASPNEMVFNINVDKNGTQAVSRTNAVNRTWLTQPLQILDNKIYVSDVSNLVNVAKQPVVAETLNDELFASINFAIDTVKQITVYNVTSLTELPSSAFALITRNSKPIVVFNDGVELGDELVITVRLGDVVIVGGERIKYNRVNYADNTLVGLTRGVQGTITKFTHETYDFIYGITPDNSLYDFYNDKTWNSETYTTTGDPLQLSDSFPGRFLQTGTK